MGAYKSVHNLKSRCELHLISHSGFEVTFSPRSLTQLSEEGNLLLLSLELSRLAWLLESLESCFERFHTYGKVLAECFRDDDLHFHNISDFEQVHQTGQPHQIDTSGPSTGFITGSPVFQGNGKLAQSNALQAFRNQHSFFGVRM